MVESRGLEPHALRRDPLSKRSRHAWPVDFPWRRVEKSNPRPYDRPGVQAQFVTLTVPSIGGNGGIRTPEAVTPDWLATSCITTLPRFHRTLQETPCTTSAYQILVVQRAEPYSTTQGSQFDCHLESR